MLAVRRGRSMLPPDGTKASKVGAPQCTNADYKLSAAELRQAERLTGHGIQGGLATAAGWMVRGRARHRMLLARMTRGASFVRTCKVAERPGGKDHDQGQHDGSRSHDHSVSGLVVTGVSIRSSHLAKPQDSGFLQRDPCGRVTRENSRREVFRRPLAGYKRLKNSRLPPV